MAGCRRNCAPARPEGGPGDRHGWHGPLSLAAIPAFHRRDHCPGVSGHAARPDGVSDREGAGGHEALDAFKRDRESTRRHAAVNCDPACWHPPRGDPGEASGAQHELSDRRCPRGREGGGRLRRRSHPRRFRASHPRAGESRPLPRFAPFAGRMGKGSDPVRDAGGASAGDRSGRDAPRSVGGGAVGGGEPCLERRLLPAGALWDSDGGLWRRRARQGAPADEYGEVERSSTARASYRPTY